MHPPFFQGVLVPLNFIVNLCGFSDRLSDENISQFTSACSSLKSRPGHGDLLT